VTDLLDLVGSTSSINTISASPAPALAITADTSPLIGNQGSATVTLTQPAASSETVELSSSDPAVTLPSSLTFSQGQSQQSFTFTIGSGFDSSHLLAVSGNLAGQTAMAYFAKPNPNLQPGVIALIGVSTTGTQSASVAPGDSIALFLTLESVAGYSGVFSQFACSGLPPGATCDFSESSIVILPGGFAQVAFNLTASSSTLAGSYVLTIGASNGETSPYVPLALQVDGFALSANPSTIRIHGPNLPITIITATFSSSTAPTISVTCNGLPAGATCTGPGALSPQSPSGTALLTAQIGMAAQDYPFQVVATYGSESASVNATLRVSSFSASLQTNSATISSGQSATFNVEFTSVNHFSNSQISLLCQSASNVICTTASPYASLSDGGTATLALIVTPPASATVMAPSLGRPWRVVLACFVLLVLSPKRSLKWWRKTLHAVVLLVLVSAISECGGGGSSTGGGGGGGSSTYSINVVAQATTGSGVLQVPVGTITLTLNQ
jgi:hypothetical protein